MPKLHQWGADALAFHCPGCQCTHIIPLTKEASKEWNSKEATWKWNGSMDAPTFTPSIHYVGSCHSFVEGGKIRFLNDCNHALAGQTVELPEWD